MEKHTFRKKENIFEIASWNKTNKNIGKASFKEKMGMDGCYL